MNEKERRSYIAKQASTDLAKVLSNIGKMEALTVGSIDYHNTRDDAKSYLERLWAHSFDFSTIKTDDAKVICAFIGHFCLGSDTCGSVRKYNKILHGLKISTEKRG